MAEPSVIACENYVRKELDRLDKLQPSKKNDKEFLLRTALYYSWLLQEKDLRVSWEKLAPLVGLATDTLILLCRDFRDYIKISNDNGFVFSDSMMEALRNILNDPKLNYNISSQVPFFRGITGENLINYLNLQDEPIGTTFTSLFMDAFRDALPGVNLQTVNDQFPHIRLVIAPEKTWSFLLAVFPNTGALEENDVERLAGHFWAIEDDIRNLYPSGLNILLFAPAISQKGTQFVTLRKQIYHVWAFSTLRFFHVLHNTLQRYTKNNVNPLTISRNFSAIFTSQGSPNVFSVRQALLNLEETVKNNKKKELTSNHQKHKISTWRSKSFEPCLGAVLFIEYNNDYLVFVAIEEQERQGESLKWVFPKIPMVDAHLSDEFDILSTAFQSLNIDLSSTTYISNENCKRLTKADYFLCEPYTFNDLQSINYDSDNFQFLKIGQQAQGRAKFPCEDEILIQALQLWLEKNFDQ